MVIRKLKPEENVHRKLMSSICFSRHYQSEDRLAWLEKPEEHAEGYENAWGAFDSDGKMLSAMIVDTAHININSKPVKVGQIIAVTSLPEARNVGGVRKIFETIHPIMKDDGMVFSLLYPFSFDYYRKFGYEHNYVKYRADFPIDGLKRYPYPTGMRVCNSWEDLAKIYDKFIQDKNMAILRTQKQWKEILKGDPHKTKDFVYIHPDAYIMYQAQNRDKTGLMHIKEIAWTSISGLEAIFGFMHGLRSEYSIASWHLPGGPDIFGVVNDPFSVKMNVESLVMTRVLNIPAALELCIAPPTKGSVVISVTYHDIYQVSWEDGKVKAEKTKLPADIETDIETLAQFTTGFMTPAQALYRPGVKIHSKMEELTALFPKKQQYLMEFF